MKTSTALTILGLLFISIIVYINVEKENIRLQQEQIISKVGRCFKDEASFNSCLVYISFSNDVKFAEAFKNALVEKGLLSNNK